MQQEDFKECPICKHQELEVRRFIEDGKRLWQIECARCGKYRIADTCIVDRDTQEKIQDNMPALAGLIREKTESGSDPIEIYTHSIDELLNSPIIPDMASVEEKANKLLRYIKDRSNFFGKRVKISHTKDYPIAYAKNDQELVALLDFLEEKEVISQEKNSMDSTTILSADGWNIAQRNLNDGWDPPKGFVAMWIHGSMKDIANTTQNAIRNMGFTPVYIETEHFSEKIVDKALGEIRKSRFVVANLTGERPSVFFEAGFAEALGVDTIFIYDKNQEKTDSLEFYAKHYKCIGYDNESDLKERLEDAIRARIVER